MKVTAHDLKSLGGIDGIVPEPLGGAHREPSAAIGALGDAIAGALGELDGLDAAALREDRRAKFLAIGRVSRVGTDGSRPINAVTFCILPRRDDHATYEKRDEAFT